jgi:hypothetical protein
MPFFCRHSRTAANRPPPRPAGPVPLLAVLDVLDVEAAADALVDELFEDPPQAARPRATSSRATRAVAPGFNTPAGLRLLRLM